VHIAGRYTRMFGIAKKLGGSSADEPTIVIETMENRIIVKAHDADQLVVLKSSSA
jgi:hypothetical protein